MNTTNAKIAEQSKAKLIKGLLIIMEHYDFSEITITQIAQEAKLSRKTFYRLFSCKEDVINAFFNAIFQDCVAQIKAQQIHDYWSVITFYFNFWEQRKTLLLLLQKNNLLTLLFEGVYQHSFEIFEFIHSKETAAYFSIPLPYLLAYSIGGIQSMLLKWIESGMEIPSSSLIDYLKLCFHTPTV